MQRSTNWAPWRSKYSDPLKTRRPKTRLGRARSLAFESLENRSLLSATVSSLGTNTGQAAPGNVTVSIASAVPTGNTVVVEIAANASATATVSDARGNVYAQNAVATNTGNVETWIFSSSVTTALSAGDLITVHFEATAPVAEAVSALAVSGLALSSPLDQVQAGTGTSTTADSGLTATTTQANELLIGAIGVPGPSTDTFTPGSGYTLVGRVSADTSPNVTINPEFRTVTAAGQYNAGATLGTSRAWGAAIATFKELSANEQFLSKVYFDFLNRPIDASGLAYWDSQLAAGQTRQQVVLSIEGTQEYANLTVQQLYQRYLHRAADPGGLSGYSSRLLAGERIEEIAAEMAGSEEFFITQGGSTNDGFLNALYQDALGRPIDSFALSFWRFQLNFVSREFVATVILNSQEYRHDVVEQAYQHLLGRSADPSGAIGWQTQLNLGATDQYVYSGIAASQEYFDKAQLQA